MSKSSVFFGLNNKRYPYQYDRSQLALGAFVFVGKDTNGIDIKFSPTPFSGSKTFAVRWISPSEWYVALEDRYKISDGIITEVSWIVGSYLEKELVRKAIEKAAQEIRLEYLYKTSEFERSNLSIIKTVADRFRVYQKLQTSPIGRILSNRHQALSVYLLLTCFDRLGQPADWMDFGTWLATTGKKDEVQKALDTIKKSGISDSVAVSQKLYESYNHIYGVKNAFFNFLKNLLPKSMRKELFDSMIISKFHIPPLIGERQELDEEEKTKYLFRLRNNYTHKARSIPGTSDTAYPEFTHILKKRWIVYEQWFEAEYWFTVSIQNWPGIFEKVVRVGFAEYLKKLLKDKAMSGSGEADIPIS